MRHISKMIAKAALDIKAVKLQPDHPFTWASGYKMPIYNDNRLILFYPEVRELVAKGFEQLMDKHGIACDMIAGTPTAGIPHGMLLADRLKKPFIYPRKQQKDHGMENRIEGVPTPSHLKDETVLMIEDLISTGKSSVESVRTVQEAGGVVKNCLSIFTYGFEKARDAFASVEVEAYSLFTLDTLIDVVKDGDYFNTEQIDLLYAWKEDPFSWGERFKDEEK